MYKVVHGITIFGLLAYVVDVEVDAGGGLPCFEMSGFINNEVREAKERVKIAVKNSGFDIPPQRIVINFSPADLKKSGTGMDLAIAMGILSANGLVKDCKKGVFIGELGFDGRIKAVNGVLPSVLKAADEGADFVVIPEGNKVECAFVEGIDIYSAERLADVVAFINGQGALKKGGGGLEVKPQKIEETEDFSDVKGQWTAKKAILTAAAGMHNIMMCGSPGSGKSMLAKRIPGIMPALSYKESIEITNIHSIAGILDPDEGLVSKRPFRTLHSSITESALVGGGVKPVPGEVTLADRGVLFMDELTLFKRQIIESLRQIIEDREVTVTKSGYSLKFPAGFMLVSAMNPCKCGFYPDRARCRCTEAEIRRHIGKISRPMLDRFDIFVKIENVHVEELFAISSEDEAGGSERGEDIFKLFGKKGAKEAAKNAYTSSSMREAVEKARRIQEDRFKDKDIDFNSEMTSEDIRKFCPLGKLQSDFVHENYEKTGLTARGCHRMLKVARTVADLKEHQRLELEDLYEACAFKNYYD